MPGEAVSVTSGTDAAGPPAPSPAEPRDEPVGRAELSWAVAGFLGFFVLLTWPLVLSPARCIVANHGDGFFDMLLFWYARQGLLLAPRVPSLFFPWGVGLGTDTAFWLVPLMSVPLQWFMPLPLVFNLLCGGFFVATGTSMYLLARECGASRGGAATAAGLLLLSPAYLNEMAQGILENMGLQWMILYLLCGIRLRRSADTRLVVAAGALFFLTWMGSWYVGILALFFTPLLAWRRLAPALLVTGILVAMQVAYIMGMTADQAAPHYDPSLLERPGRREPARDAGNWHPANTSPQRIRLAATYKVLDNSADFSRLTQREWLELMNDALPTFVLLELALLGWWFAPRATRHWGMITLLLLYFSLGPFFIWKGEPTVQLPTAWLYALVPALAALRPVRYLLGATFGLCMMAAFAPPRLRSTLLTGLMVAALVGAQATEALWLHVAHYRIRLATTDVPAWYHQLAQEDTGSALIEIPFDSFSLEHGRRLFYQSVHRHPLLNHNFLRDAGKLDLLQKVQDNSLLGVIEGITAAVQRKDVETLRTLGYRYLVLHTSVQRGEGKRKELGLFRGRTFHALRRLCGEPRNVGDDLLVTDLNDVMEDCWDGSGVLDATQDLIEICSPDPILVPPGETCVLGHGAAAAPTVELTMWMAGSGLEVTAWRGGTCVGRTTCRSDDWTWIRLPLGVGRRGPSPGAPTSIQVRVSAPSTLERGTRAGCPRAHRTEGTARPPDQESHSISWKVRNVLEARLPPPRRDPPAVLRSRKPGLALTRHSRRLLHGFLARAPRHPPRRRAPLGGPVPPVPPQGLPGRPPHHGPVRDRALAVPGRGSPLASQPRARAGDLRDGRTGCRAGG